MSNFTNTSPRTAPQPLSFPQRLDSNTFPSPIVVASGNGLRRRSADDPAVAVGNGIRRRSGETLVEEEILSDTRSSSPVSLSGETIGDEQVSIGEYMHSNIMNALSYYEYC